MARRSIEAELRAIEAARLRLNEREAAIWRSGELLTIAQFARKHRLTTRAVRYQIGRGEIPSVKISPRPGRAKKLMIVAEPD